MMMMMMMILYIAFCFFGALVAAGEQLSLEMPVISREDMVKIAGYGEDKLSTVLITGSVLCEEEEEAGLRTNGIEAWNVPTPQPVSGALVGVNCQMGRDRRSRPCWTRGRTDENGDFSIDLPSHLHATPLLHRKCSVRLLRIPEDSPCGPTYLHGHRRIRPWSIRDGVRTYSAGRIRLVKSKRTEPNSNRARSSHGETADR